MKPVEGRSSDGATARPTLSQQVAATIKSDILAGRLAPGERLQEVALAQRCGVSRVPVREALRLLHAERLVEVVANREAVVATVDDDEASQLVEVRLSLEELIVRCAARRSDQRTTWCACEPSSTPATPPSPRATGGRWWS